VGGGLLGFWQLVSVEVLLALGGDIAELHVVQHVASRYVFLRAYFWIQISRCMFSTYIFIGVYVQCVKRHLHSLSKETYLVCQKRPACCVKRDLHSVSKEPYAVCQKSPTQCFKRNLNNVSEQLYTVCQKSPKTCVKRDLKNV
jgi:hypothetical protein